MCLKIQYQDLYFNIKFYRLRFWKKKHVINGMYNVECTLYIVNVHQPLKSQTARGHFLSPSQRLKETRGPGLPLRYQLYHGAFLCGPVVL